MTTAVLPISPIVPTNAGPAAKADVVQFNLSALTGQIVTGAEFGMGTIMGDFNHTYLPYTDPSFQAVADQHPMDLLRHNWELNTFMDIMFPSRASASRPDFSYIDNFLSQQGNLKSFFNNDTGTQVITLGFPSWLNISSVSDQALYAGMVKEIAQHLIAAGEPVHDYELVNEPDGYYNVTDMANTFNALALALKSIDPTYRLGGLTETYVRQDDLQTFFQIAGPNIGFVSWHQYVTNGSDGKSDQQVVTDSMNVQGDAQKVRAEMQAAGIPDSVPLFLGEYNVNGAVYDDPNNGNMVGAVAAAATTYAMIHSNTNMTMGALWAVENGSAYSAFGLQGAYHADPVAVVLVDLTAYMPGNLVQTTMPSNTPGLVGYTTKDGQGFSVALIDTNLSQSYTVDLSNDGLPTTGVYRVEVSNANPQGIKTPVTDLSHVAVAAGSVVIITDEVPHGGVEFTGTPVTAPSPTPTLTQSANDTVVTGTASAITDASGNQWTITRGRQVAVNGIADTTTANVVELAYVNGAVWQENSSNLWWDKTSPTAAWTGGTATSPLPLSIIIPRTQASATFSLNQMSIVATSGNHMVFITGKGDTVTLSGGNNTITDTGSSNKYVIPAAGKGYDTFTNNILTAGDTLDLRSALAATNWNGSASTVSNYLKVANTTNGTVLSIAPTSGGAAMAIVTLGATTTNLSGLLAHAVL